MPRARTRLSSARPSADGPVAGQKKSPGAAKGRMADFDIATMWSA
jgi:hypothetical protein